MTEHPKKPHGGARPGAGRPKKQLATAGPTTAPPAEFQDAQGYLLAVVLGTTPPDPVRVSAARALLPFQKAKTRAPVASPPPKQLAQREELANENAAREAWNLKAAAVRAKHAKDPAK